MKKTLFILFFLMALFHPQTFFAQIQKIDSLKNVLKRHTSDNSKKVDIMNEIGYLIFSDDPQKAMKYATESGNLSNILNYTKGKATSLWLNGLAHTVNDKKTAIKYFEQSLKIAKSINNKEIICDCLISIGATEKILGNIKKSDESFEQAHKIATEINNKTLILKCLVNIARNYTGKGEYEKSIKILEEAIDIAKELNNNLILSKALNNLASIYAIQSKYTVALSYYLEALKINEKMGNQSVIIANHHNIAQVLSSQKQYKEALEYLQRSLHTSEEIGDNHKIVLSLTAIGNIHMKMGNSMALEYYEKSLKIIDNNENNINLKIDILTDMGTIRTKQKEFKKALNNLNEALVLSKKIGLKRANGNILSKIGLVYFHQKHYSEALNYTNESLLIANELNLLRLKKTIHGQLSDIYAETNNYKDAYLNHKKYKLYNDSIFNENNVKELADLDNSYKIEKAKEVYEIDAKNKELLIKNQRGFIIFMTIAFILVFSLAIMTVRSYKLKKRVLNLELEEANVELEKNKREMTSATLKLVQTAERDIRSIKMLEDIEKNQKTEVRDEIKSLIFDYKSQAHNTNWEEFEILFQKVHTSFYKNLNDRFPMLTQNERKLCVFLKLNMSNKQIAQITFQSEEALKKARLRLRKKLNIDREINIVSFIQDI